MTSYKMSGAGEIDPTEGVILATHPAHAGTFIVYASKNTVLERAPVVLWGVDQYGCAVPITMSGPWDGTSNTNGFVLHPTGDCSRYDGNWASLDEAVADLLPRADE
jgi:hypothetical protein